MAEKILVTGGGGFLGKALIHQLIARGHQIHTLNRSRYPELEKLGVRCFQGDLADPAIVKEAALGCTTVFHVAAKAGVWGDYADYYKANVIGTQNVLLACRALSIPRLIYTSSPSITFGGTDQEGIDESNPLPTHYMAAYPATKALAEKMVLAAAGSDLATVSLRPHLIWGPGDNHIIPRLLDRARKGRLRLIGPAGKKVDAVYIDNAVQAHLCAYDRLQKGSPIDGKVYFITNDEPMPLENIINSILQAAGLPQVTRRISAGIAYGLGATLEIFYRLLRLKNEPVLTRFAARQMSTAHWYNTRAAREELGYQPAVSMQEGFRRLRLALQG
ncbi:MAG: NAD-dependent epimerase/dehydratase family protein [Pseudobdellovibrionaceae bacterium]|nr:NAD-dependent epimerase/dehydratase family protein [Pseudobdellovibrionaceae bacterium]